MDLLQISNVVRVVKMTKHAASSLESAPLAATYRTNTQGKSGSDSKGKGSGAVIISDALEAISLKLKFSPVVGKNYQGNDFADVTLTKRSGRKQETKYPGEKENFYKAS